MNGDRAVRSDVCPACGTDVYADFPRWVLDLQRRLATLADRHQPVSYTVGGLSHCNACGDTYPCADARILAGMNVEG